MALIGTMKYLTIGDKTYEIDIPIASASTLGGIKVGSGLTIDSTTGVLSATGTSITIDTEMSDSSTNPVQNKVIKDYVDDSVGGIVIPTKVSDLTNDSGYITGYTETDPTVPSWAKETTKPTYTYSEVGAAASSHTHGNITNGGDITATAPTIANGDQIIINDNSASKITNGPTFDGSTTTKALTQKGTWETFLQSYTESDPVFSASAAAGITSTDISNWNNKVSDDKTWNGVTLSNGGITSGTVYVPARLNITDTTAYNLLATITPTSQKIAMYNGDAYLNSTTPSANDNSTKVATTAYVDSAITALPEPMIFKGSLGTGGTITSLPTAAASNEGYTYKVITAGTYASQSAKVGDTFISDGSSWVLIPSGDEPSGTVTSVGLSNATNGGLSISGSPITSSGSITVGHSNVLTSAQTTQAVYPIKIDKNGHISAYGTAVSIPTKTSDLTNNSDFITSSSLSDYVLKTSNLLGIAANISNDTGAINIYGINGNNVGVGIQVYGNDLSIYKIENSQTTSVFTYDADTDQVSLTKLITPTNNSDAATKKYVDDSIPTVPTISLNGSSTTSPSFYAPTSAGTSGYVLTSSGSGAPTWAAAPSSPSYTATSPIDITGNDISHEDSGVTAGTYDGGGVKSSGFYVPSITVDAKGHVTSATDLGNLIPVVTSSNSNGEVGNLIGAWTWALATRSYSSYPTVLAAGNTSQTITISSDNNSGYTYKNYFRVVDVEAFDAVTKEPVIVDWSASALYSNNSSVTVTVSIASAHTNNIWLYVLLSIGYGSM